jgi:hypothetical protein
VMRPRRRQWSSRSHRSVRVVRRRAATLLALVPVLAVTPSIALAAPTSPLSPGLPAAPVQTQTATTPPLSVPGTSSSTDNGLSGSGAIAIAVGAVVVLGGISLFIWRDARRRAPVRHRSAVATAEAGGRAGSKTRAKPRKLSPAERRRRKRGRAR